MRGVAVQGELVRTARVQRAMTQADLARVACLDVKTVRKAEQGKRIDVAPLTRLAQVLEIELENLIVPEKPDADLLERRRQTIFAWVRAFDAQDMEATLRVYHEDAVLTIPGGPHVPFGGVFRGKEAIRQANLTTWSLARQEPSTEEELSLHLSDTAITMRAEKGIYLPDGELVRFPCMQIFTFVDDLIHEHEVQFDTLDYVRRMNLPS